jgi:hypothetical protein
MGVEENDVRPISLEVQSEVKAEEELIEQVFSQEPEDVTTVEPSIESEDQETFEETAKFEEDIDTPKAEPKSQQKKARKVTTLEQGLVRNKVFGIFMTIILTRPRHSTRKAG